MTPVCGIREKGIEALSLSMATYEVSNTELQWGSSLGRQVGAWVFFFFFFFFLVGSFIFFFFVVGGCCYGFVDDVRGCLWPD